MSKFKAGDIITGTSSNTYCISNEKGIYRVRHVNCNTNAMRISVLYHSDPLFRGKHYLVYNSDIIFRRLASLGGE